MGPWRTWRKPTTPGSCIRAAADHQGQALLHRQRSRSVAMLRNDIEDVAVRCPDEEAGDAPLLGGQGMHDLVLALLRLGVGGLNIVDHDRDHRVLWRGG